MKHNVDNGKGQSTILDSGDEQSAKNNAPLHLFRKAVPSLNTTPAGLATVAARRSAKPFKLGAISDCC